MIFSEQWIRDWVTVPVDRQTLVQQLTMAGLEVDSVEPVAGQFSGIVVGEVLAVEPHPDADKLRVCQVSDGSLTMQVVCGAPNVRPGLKVPFARVDAILPGESADKPLRIRQAKLRGVESNGMLCSAAELGLTEDNSGLLELPVSAVPGADMRSWLQLDDSSITLDLTPNRGDCLGIAGIAREIAVLNRVSCTPLNVPDVPATIEDTFPVSIQVPDACPRYLGRVIRGVNISAETPLWMQEKLRRSGLRSIDPVVDVTNYVLLELGQPMHAFDLERLTGGIQVRMAHAGEPLTLLDGKKIILQPDTMVIADASRALAMAGIMGGEESAVSASTQDIFLECAFFAPLAVAGKARRYGLHTDSSHRYERGVDHGLQHRAMQRATALLLELAGGQAGPVTEQTGNLPAPVEVALKFANVERMLGLRIAAEEVVDILERLGLVVRSRDVDVLKVTVPSWRFDIAIEADLIEEIARIYGYDRMPSTRSLARLGLRPQPETVTPLDRIKDRLVALGYQEVITYSFVEPRLQASLCPADKPVPVQNPISSDMSVMRTSLWPGLIAACQHNANRQQDRIRLFETGQVFLSDGNKDAPIAQPTMIAGLLSGSRLPALWASQKGHVDFFDLKGDVESLLSLSRNRLKIVFSKGDHPALHTGQCAELYIEGARVGILGALNPRLQRELDINFDVYLFELQMDKLQQSTLPKFQELSRFPEVSRDLAVVIDRGVSGAQIEQLVRENAGSLLKSLRIFDVYQGDAIEKSKKSIALGLTLQHPSRTLGDDDINSIISKCVKELEDKFNAKLRN